MTKTQNGKKEYGKRFAVFLIGLCLIQIGVAVFLQLNIGSDPFTVFTQGIAKLLHVTPGNANRMITVILCIAIFIFDKHYIKVGTIISIFCAGFILDGMLYFIQNIPLAEYSILIRCILFAVAMVPIAIGIPMIKIADVGVAPNDSVYFVLEDRLKLPYSKVRIMTDGIYFVLGILCGGVVGIGTIICLAVLGPMVDVFFPRVEKIVARCGYQRKVIEQS